MKLILSVLVEETPYGCRYIERRIFRHTNSAKAQYMLEICNKIYPWLGGIGSQGDRIISVSRWTWRPGKRVWREISPDKFDWRLWQYFPSNALAEMPESPI